jgi:hypothetical protein
MKLGHGDAPWAGHEASPPAVLFSVVLISGSDRCLLAGHAGRRCVCGYQKEGLAKRRRASVEMP